MRLNFLFSVFLFSLLTGLSVFAGGETQNGGYGVKVGRKIVSLDLFLRGSDRDPNLSEGAPMLLNESELAMVKDGLKDFRPIVVKIVIQKLSDIRAKLTQKGLSLQTDFMISNLNQYTYVVMSSVPCLDVGDDHSPIPGKVQLAYREAQWIRFCKESQFLDDANQAALILHELVYSSLWEKALTQEFVGLTFHQDFQTLDGRAGIEFSEIVKVLAEKSKFNSLPSPEQANLDPYVKSILNGDIEAVRKFLVQGKSPNEKVKSKSGSDFTETPLHLAYYAKKWDIFDLLVASGANVNERLEGPYQSYLEEAVAKKYNQVVASILASPLFTLKTGYQGKEFGWLTVAVGAENLRAVELFLQRGANPNLREAVIFEPELEMPPLLYAIKKQNLELVQALLAAKNIDVEIFDGDNGAGCHPLHWAALRSGSPEIVRALVAAGAEVDSRCTSFNNTGQTPLMALASSGQPNPEYTASNSVEVAMALVEAGADLGAIRYPGNYTVLHEAIRSKNSALAIYFIQAGSELNAFAGLNLNFDVSNFNTPLMEAVKARMPEVVKALIEAGADVNLKTPKSPNGEYSSGAEETALARARQLAKSEGVTKNLRQCIDLLVAAGATE